MARITSRLSADTAAYIAGLIDGEGTVTMTRLHASENRRLVVSIANTELQILQFVIDAVGAGKITRKKTTSDRHTPSYCYAVTSRQALALLRQILPHMKSYKRLRARLALDQYEAVTPRNGRYTSSHRIERSKFEANFFALLPCGKISR